MNYAPVYWVPGVEWLWCAVDHLLFSCAKAKNEWSYTSPPPPLNGVPRDCSTTLQLYEIFVVRDTSFCISYYCCPQDYCTGDLFLWWFWDETVPLWDFDSYWAHCPSRRSEMNGYRSLVQ